MKLKIGIIVLVVLSVGLFVALLATKKQAEDIHVKDTTSILEFSNQLDTANLNLNDERQVNLMLTNDIVATRQALQSRCQVCKVTFATDPACARADLLVPVGVDRWGCTRSNPRPRRTPHACPLHDLCWPPWPKDNVFTLAALVPRASR